MSMPFYADAEKLSSQSAGDTTVKVLGVYAVLIALAALALAIGDKADSVIIKILSAIWIVGVPSLLFYRVRAQLMRHADEYVIGLYKTASAEIGIVSVCIMMFWEVSSRWFLVNHNLHDTLVALLPYLVIFLIFMSVRKQMKEASATKD